MLETPMPAFTDNNIPVVFACSDVFIPHAAAAMQSLIEHSSASYNYDLTYGNFRKQSTCHADNGYGFCQCLIAIC